MISPDYFSNRWSWYRPILSRGDVPANRCLIDVRRIPLRIPGEDAKEYIPFAVHSQLQVTLFQALSRLQDYIIRYAIKGEKVSAHQLPKTTAEAREVMLFLRKKYPHLSRTLLHHWCADERGASALLSLWRDLWSKGWQQERADLAPWVPAVNVLLLRLTRETLAKLPKEHIEQTSHAMLCILGGLYNWALMAFLKQHAEGILEVTRIAAYESMVLPATPMAFMQYQPEDALLADDRNVIMAYGLAPDLVPRMRELRKRVGPKNEAGILALLGKDRLGANLLRRSWARLALWDLAEQTGEGIWMRWVLDAKLLDRMLTSPDQLEPTVVDMLEANRKHDIAAWLLKKRSSGGSLISKGKGDPWLRDDRTLQAFLVYEEDLEVEIARRRSERLWLDQAIEIAGRSRGADADKILESAYRDGKIVFLMPGPEASLHCGTKLSSKQACLMIDWSDFLGDMSAHYGSNAAKFIEKTFLPDVLDRIGGDKKVFVDSLSASGCILRGLVVPLVEIGSALRQLWREWHRDSSHTSEESEGSSPPIAMCLALIGEWNYAEYSYAGGLNHRLAFSMSVPQASAGLSRDCSTGRLAKCRDAKSAQSPCGEVRVERVDTGTGRHVELLYNNGFAMTVSAISELSSVLRDRAEVSEFRIDRKRAQSILREFRLPEGQFDLFCIQHQSEKLPLLLLKVGRPCLAGVDVDLYELLDSDSPAAMRIVEEGLPIWK